MPNQLILKQSNKIYNPKTGRWVNSDSKLGKQLSKLKSKKPQFEPLIKPSMIPHLKTFSKNILYKYLRQNNVTVKVYKKAVNEFNKYDPFNNHPLEKICGDLMYDQLLGYFMDDDDDDDDDEIDSVKIMLLKDDSPISVFLGFIDTDEKTKIKYLESSTTCSSKLPKAGALLRFLGLLLANDKDKSVQTMSGSIAGGIPAITDDDTPEQEKIKKQRLINYHKKLGAEVTPNGKKFTYHLNKVLEIIPSLYIPIITKWEQGK